MEFKKYFQVLLLVTVIVLKVSSLGLHMSFHHEDSDFHQDQCELCEYAVSNQDLETYIPTTLSDFNVTSDNFSEKKNFYQSVDHKSLVASILFGRPPPSLI